MLVPICFPLLPSSGSWLNPVSSWTCCGCHVVWLADRKAILIFQFPAHAFSFLLFSQCPWPMAFAVGICFCFVSTIVVLYHHHFKIIAWTLPLSEDAFPSTKTVEPLEGAATLVLSVFYPSHNFGKVHTCWDSFIPHPFSFHHLDLQVRRQGCNKFPGGVVPSLWGGSEHSYMWQAHGYIVCLCVGLNVDWQGTNGN